MKPESFFYPSADRVHQIHAIRWYPDGPPRAIVQITHGMTEHILRYDEVARHLAAQGFLVTGHDHLGHGRSVNSPDDYGYFADHDANATVLQDIHTLAQLTREAYPGLPHFLLGHSMGSFYARQYLFEHGGDLAGGIIVGTGHQPAALVQGGRALCALLAKVKGWRHRSERVNGMVFGVYNKRFPGARTTMDWLNRDPAAVDGYISDPACGFLFTLNGYHTMFTGMLRLHDRALLARIPKDLPVLFLAGDQDPVGDAGQGVLRAADSIKQAGVEDVEVRLYPGGRHEILGELCKEEVFADLSRWFMRFLK